MDPKQVIRTADGAMECRQCGFRYELDGPGAADSAGRGLEEVDTALARVPEGDRGRRPAPDVWSVNAYIFHLAGAAKLVYGRVRTMMEADNPPLPNQDQDSVVAEGRGDEQPAAQSLAALRPTVAAFQAYVAALPPAALQRTGQHSTAGQVRLRDIMHDLPHELHHHAADIRRVGGEVGTR